MTYKETIQLINQRIADKFYTKQEIIDETRIPRKTLNAILELRRYSIKHLRKLCDYAGLRIPREDTIYFDLSLAQKIQFITVITLEKVKELHGYNYNDLASKSRVQDLAQTRQRFCLALREISKNRISMEGIGRILDRDHSTISHGCKMASIDIEMNQMIREDYNLLISEVSKSLLNLSVEDFNKIYITITKKNEKNGELEKRRLFKFNVITDKSVLSAA